MFLVRRFRRRRPSGDEELDERTREENEKFRAGHDALIHVAEPAADRWQRQTDDEFKPPSY
jgi:hypothetical protein